MALDTASPPTYHTRVEPKARPREFDAHTFAHVLQVLKNEEREGPPKKQEGKKKKRNNHRSLRWEEEEERPHRLGRGTNERKERRRSLGLFLEPNKPNLVRRKRKEKPAEEEGEEAEGVNEIKRDNGALNEKEQGQRKESGLVARRSASTDDVSQAFHKTEQPRPEAEGLSDSLNLSKQYLTLFPVFLDFLKRTPWSWVTWAEVSTAGQ